MQLLKKKLKKFDYTNIEWIFYIESKTNLQWIEAVLIKDLRWKIWKYWIFLTTNSTKPIDSITLWNEIVAPLIENKKVVWYISDFTEQEPVVGYKHRWIWLWNQLKWKWIAMKLFNIINTLDKNTKIIEITINSAVLNFYLKNWYSVKAIHLPYLGDNFTNLKKTNYIKYDLNENQKNLVHNYILKSKSIKTLVFFVELIKYDKVKKLKIDSLNEEIEEIYKINKDSDIKINSEINDVKYWVMSSSFVRKIEKAFWLNPSILEE